MSAGAVIAIIAVVGALIGAYIYRCDIDFLKFLCDATKAQPKNAVTTGANIVGRTVAAGHRKAPPTGSIAPKGTSQVVDNIRGGWGQKSAVAGYTSLFSTERLSI